ncbi:restriction endonuclease subunit S [Sporolactobacillus sp. Y61]|uniref:Restriction endonuclease subunit S n=1 Tax=Sporolactobacillus sp. Y61 TaxID=3160863 RepID=A0AAU8IFB6_9BACL
MEFEKTKIGKIPTKWIVTSICDIGDVVGGGTPKKTVDEYWNGDISWITPKDLSNYNRRLICTGHRKITNKGLCNSSAKLLPKGTVLFSSRAPIGYLAIAGKELCTNQGFKSIICNKEKINNYFLYYLLIVKRRQLENIAGGSTFKEISGKVLKEFEIPLPPIEEQNVIARMLSLLDDKIELNTRINQNLYLLKRVIKAMIKVVTRFFNSFREIRI